MDDYRSDVGNHPHAFDPRVFLEQDFKYISTFPVFVQSGRDYANPPSDRMDELAILQIV